ncbi:hypothetical protein OG874_06375 [Nocardia sp. NBC_00565]|uniref:hypothetical protein n=1 Tax=Nocardia sp. NBC_00565 TaxID=2975993 RepID=UPI002E812384|nr:hypothetical protein [Nocardia sp. NBC_00565]WUC04792.1 hypothetical protein OG874_06375 [Nocardia sp. NBC_00565]
MVSHRSEPAPDGVGPKSVAVDLPLAAALVDPETVKFLHQELAQANAKTTASFAAALASATVGSALIAAALFNLPRPCNPPDLTEKCVPADWNSLYALVPLLSVLVAVIVMETTSRFIALGIYATDIERQINRFQPITIFAVDAKDGVWTTRTVPSSEQMLAGFVSEEGRRFSVRPVNIILWTSCLSILVTAVVIPILLIESTSLRIVTAVVYAQLVYLVARFTVSYAGQPRRFAHELWRNALAAAGSSADRHTQASDIADFIRFLIYPRQLGDHWVKFAISGAAIPAAIFSSQDGHVTIARGLLTWAFVELVLYPIRYQINDIRDYKTDSEHPAKTARKRTPFGLTPERERTVATTMIYRLAAAFALGYLYGLSWVEWLWVAVFTAVFAASTWLYEALKSSFKTEPMQSLDERTPKTARALIALCASGYSLRVGFVFAATVQAFTADKTALWAILMITIGIAEYYLLKNQWATEGTSFVETPLPTETVDDTLRFKPHITLALRDSKILRSTGVTTLSTDKLRDRQQPQYKGHPALDLGIEIEPLPVNGSSAELFVPRLVHLARSRRLITLSHLCLLTSVAAMAAGFAVIGPHQEGRRRLLIIAIFVAAFFAIDQLHQLAQRAIMPSSAKNDAEPLKVPNFGKQAIVTVSLLIFNILAFAALGACQSLLTELNWRQGLYALIPALLWVMAGIGESTNYRAQRVAAQEFAAIIETLRSSPKGLREKIFGTHIKGEPAAGR